MKEDYIMISIQRKAFPYITKILRYDENIFVAYTENHRVIKIIIAERIRGGAATNV